MITHRLILAGLIVAVACTNHPSAPIVTGPPPLRFAVLSAGLQHSCGITTEGAAYCWGTGAAGQLGNGAMANSDTPVPVAGGLDFASISAGQALTCGVTTDGTGYCWGLGTAGQLGNGTNANSGVPVPIVGELRWASTSAGNRHACGVTTSGLAYCWGGNTAGQNGDGTIVGSNVPVPVAGGLSFASVTVSWTNHTCGVTIDATAYCWGSNQYGELGNGTTESSAVPVAVAGGQRYAALDGGFLYTCGLTTGGAVNCWGRNDAGQLGSGTAVDSSSIPLPVAGGGLTFTALGVGGAHSCATATDGVLYCWGGNAEGEFGDGTTVDRSVPGRGAGGLRFLSISLGAFHSCGIATSGVAYCWGDGAFGELGSGSTMSSSVPVAVGGD